MSAPGLAPYAGSRVLVLGASGFIGAWIARAAADAGAELHVALRDPAALERTLPAARPPAAVHALDATDADAVRRVLASVAPALTFNAIGYGVARDERDPGLARALNAELPAIACEALAGSDAGPWPGQRLVHLGSALEYGTVAGDLDEAGPRHPTTLYGQTKLAGTEAVSARARQQRFAALTARLFTVYGPGEHAGRLVPTLLEARRSASPIALTAGAQLRDFTYVGDVAEGLLRLGVTAPNAAAAVLNLATGALHSVRHFVEVAARAFGLDGARLRFGEVPTRSEEMQHDPVSIRRLRAALDWQPETTLLEGLRRTVQIMDGDGA